MAVEHATADKQQTLTEATNSDRISNDYRFAEKMQRAGLDLKSQRIDTLQINITKLCNQACTHCHVDASPRRREMMSEAVIQKVIELMQAEDHLRCLDITGGAPELHPQFRELVTKVRDAGKQVMVRHNLTVTFDPHPIDRSSLNDLPEFFAKHGVILVSSLPYYQEYFTNKQRGSGVFQKSIKSLQQLNEVGYGKAESGLEIHLVYNPVGAFLPPDQKSLETTYKQELDKRYGIKFNQLFVITNMPIHRFKAQLKRLNSYEEYMEKLAAGFNPQAALGIMCRSLVSVSHEGTLYDCDFNQMLDYPVRDHSTNSKKPWSIFDWNQKQLEERTIRVADHCFGCTAGAGSSCGGATA